MIAPLPPDEQARLLALHDYHILDTDSEDAYDDIARLAAFICGTPIAAVTLIDYERQWFKAVTGLDATETPREDAFCAHTILQTDVMIVPDAQADPRFADNPLVMGDPNIRFYAGAPLLTGSGYALGSLCVVDHIPRNLTSEQGAALRTLARHVVEKMELTRQVAEKERLIAERGVAADLRQAGENAVRQLGAAVESMTAGVVITEARQRDNRITYANPAFLFLTGYEMFEVIGRNCRFLQGAETNPDAKQRIRSALDAGRACRVTLLNYRRDGSTFWNELTIAPVRDDKGEITQFVGIQHDITALKQSQARLVEAQRIGGIGDWELDVASLCFTWSAEVFRLMEFDPARGEPFYEEVLARYHPDDRAERDRLFARALTTGEPYQCDLRLLLPSGTPRWFHLIGQPVLNTDGQVVRVAGTAADITERKHQEEAVRQSEERLRLALESARLGSFLLDLTTNQFQDLSATFKAQFGLPPDAEFSRADFYQAVHVEDRSHVQETFLRAVAGGQDVDVEYRCLWPDGSVHWINSHWRLYYGAGGDAVRMIGVTQEVTERKRIEVELTRGLHEAQERADRDPLTGLLNHRVFHKRLAEEAERALREGTTLAVVMLDLDNFKFFNDCYGHATGDEVLRHMAERLQGACRLYDTLARFGGDEFAILLPGVGTTTTAAEIESRLRADFRGITYRLAAQEAPVPITVSIGAALFPRDGLDPSAVVRQADERLLRSKTGGASEMEADRVRAHAGRSLGGFSMLDALVTAVDNKDRYTRRHSEDVMEYSLLIAQGLGLGEEERRTVAVAALLHDVGKIGVPDAILRKPGKLTDVEFEAIRQHPQMGAIIVSAVPGLEDTLDAVRHHHERWDGGGYPFGLRGAETPLIARLMAVADGFSAMTTDRPYRKGMARERALSILADGSGTQWDPQCVLAFERSLRGLNAAP